MSVRGFNTGAGVERYDYNALDNIPVTTNTRVKGDAESEYRTGNVNLTKANIGLGNVDNTSDAQKPVSTAQQIALEGKADKTTVDDLSRQLSDVVGVDEWYDADLWLEGHLNSATGAISTSPTYNRMGTPNLIPANVTCIKVQEGYKIIPYCWSADGSTYLGLWNGTAPQKTWDETVWMVGTVDLKAISTEYRFKILAQLATGSRQLTPEADADKFIFASFSDETLSISGKAADAKATGDRIANVESKVSNETTGLDTKAPVIINTASGDIASFDDGADSMLIRKLMANIEPVQDLHGYDHPWPAGGGKNLLNLDAIPSTQTKNGITFTNNGDGTVTVNGTATTEVTIASGNIMMAGNCKFTSGLIGNTNAGVYTFIYCTTDTARPYQWDGTNRVTNEYRGQFGEVAFEEGKNYVYDFRIISGVTVNNVTFRPMICASTETDSTFAPYSNICPINGHTGMVGKRTGKNLLPYPSSVPQAGSTVTQYGVTMTHNEDGTLSFAGTAQQQMWFYINTYTADHSRDFQFVPGDYIISSGISGETGTAGYRFQMSIYENGAMKMTAIDTGSGANLTINDGETEAVYLYVPSGKNMDGITIKPMLRLASDTDATFEPYIEKDISVNWQDTAGTVYGVTLDVVSGALTVDRETFSIDGSTNITSITEMTNVIRFWVYTDARFMLPGSQNYFKNMSDRLTISFDYAADKTSFLVSDQYKQSLIIKLPKGTCEATAAGIRAYLQANPLQFVLPLANPVTYQLTPQEITTLLGTNNIWTDVGPVSVEYPADTKLYIEKLTQPTEDDMTADHAISSGTFFMIGNTLYLATSQIAAGATITPGTNATQLSLADALNQLNT